MGLKTFFELLKMVVEGEKKVAATTPTSRGETVDSPCLLLQLPSSPPTLDFSFPSSNPPFTRPSSLWVSLCLLCSLPYPGWRGGRRTRR